MTAFEQKVAALRAHHEALLSLKNEPVEWGNGIYEKYKIIIVKGLSKSSYPIYIFYFCCCHFQVVSC